jgi:hypothetical protein
MPWLDGREVAALPARDVLSRSAKASPSRMDARFPHHSRTLCTVFSPLASGPLPQRYFGPTPLSDQLGRGPGCSPLKRLAWPQAACQGFGEMQSPQRHPSYRRRGLGACKPPTGFQRAAPLAGSRVRSTLCRATTRPPSCASEAQPARWDGGNVRMSQAGESGTAHPGGGRAGLTHIRLFVRSSFQRIASRFLRPIEHPRHALQTTRACIQTQHFVSLRA